MLKKGQALDDFDSSLLIESEIYTLARTMQSLIWHNFGAASNVNDTPLED
jgi:hypothetical protein